MIKKIYIWSFWSEIEGWLGLDIWDFLGSSHLLHSYSFIQSQVLFLRKIIFYKKKYIFFWEKYHFRRNSQERFLLSTETRVMTLSSFHLQFMLLSRILGFQRNTKLSIPARPQPILNISCFLISFSSNSVWRIK